MYVVNASVRAWNNGYAIPKFFGSLEAVEKHYKSWIGVSKLASKKECEQCLSDSGIPYADAQCFTCGAWRS